MGKKHKPIKEGDAAPDFTLPTQEGKSVQLSKLWADKVVVLFFYPKDFSPVCTTEVCAFRDSYQDFQDAGAEVVGISSDSVDSHDKFAKKKKVPFPLVSDESSDVRDAYGVPAAMFVFPGRTTYVIDTKGIVRDVFTAHLSGDDHVDQALKIVKKLAKSAKAA